MTPSQLKKIKQDEAAQADTPVTKPSHQKPPPDNYASYKTHGLNENPMASPEGRRMVMDYESRGYSPRQAQDKVRELMESSSTKPVAKELSSGEVLFKVIPEGGTISGNSAYFMKQSELDALKGLDANAIGGRLGLPLESQLPGKFEVFEVVANRPTTVYNAEIARTSQNGWNQPGGGVQTLITDRSAFSPPIKTARKLP